MKKKQQKRLHKQRRYHIQDQKAKREAALEAASSSDDPHREMQTSGYVADKQGGWKLMRKIRRKQPRKPE